MALGIAAHHDVTSVTDMTRPFVSHLICLAFPKSSSRRGTQHPLRRNDQNFREMHFRHTNLSLEVCHETHQHLGFDSMCVLRVRGMGPAAGKDQQWSEFHRPNMKRWNPCETVLNVNNVGSLGLKWSYTTGNDVDSSPAVADGVVYVGSEDDNVYALNASTGAKLWSYATGSDVYFLAGRGEWSGLCRLVRPQRVRAERQHRRPAVELLHRRLVWSSPAVANGVVYVGSYDKNVYALDASTGAKLWSYTTGGYV